MAYLELVSGTYPQPVVKIERPCVVFGRNPQCDVVLESASVSRYHAQILESHGSYFVEDLHSRNGTQLNQVDVEGRKELADADEITICELVFRFRLAPVTPGLKGASATDSFRQPVAGAPPETRQHIEPPVDDDSRYVVGQAARDTDLDSSSILAALEAGSSSDLRPNVQPETKLRAIVDISKSLGRILDVDQVLERILDGLFKLFPQADEGCVVLKEEPSGKLVVRAARHRCRVADRSVSVSMTVVRRAMETGDGLLTANVLADKRFESSASMAGLKTQSVMCTPFIGATGQALGGVQISTGQPSQVFSREDLDLLISVAAQGSLAIENVTLYQAAMQQRILERELEFATQVQLGFLPHVRPKLADYEFYDYYQPAQRVGGDFFDYVPLHSGRLAVVVADVAGKGIPAALLMARVYSLARNHLQTHPNVAAALTALNAEISTTGLGHRFITCVMAVIDPAQHEVSIANAGHLSPVLRMADDQVSLVGRRESGFPLGIVPEQQFQELSLALGPGDACLLYTDGVTEAFTLDKELYGTTRLMHVVAAPFDSLEQLVKRVISDVEDFSGGNTRGDDTCLVAFRRLTRSP